MNIRVRDYDLSQATISTLNITSFKYNSDYSSLALQQILEVQMEILPLVSIITPVYNSEIYLGDFFESILSQTYKNIEVIIINDGSNDSSEDIILKYQKLFISEGIKFVYIFQSHNGQASALNKGLQVFKGEFFTWPDSDDILPHNSIGSRIEFLLNNNAELVRGKRLFFNIKGTYYNLDNLKNYYSFPTPEEVYSGRTFTSGGCYIMSRNLFTSIYPDKTIYAGLGSQNWQLIVPAVSYRNCLSTSDVVYYVRNHADSFSRRKRNLKELYANYDDLINILKSALSKSNANFDYEMNMVNAMFTRRKMNSAYITNNLIAYREYYYKALELGILTNTDNIKNIFSLNRVTYKLSLFGIKIIVLLRKENLINLYYKVNYLIRNFIRSTINKTKSCFNR